jgi:hypothetical protein
VLLRRLRHERLELLGAAAGGLDVAPGAEREVGLEAVVHLVLERALRDHALLHAGHVRGGDVHERRARAAGQHAPVQVDGAQEVRLEALVDRRIEADGGGRVDRDVDAGRDLRLSPAEVPVHDRRALVQETLQRVLVVALPKHGEGRLAQEVLDAVPRGGAGLPAHEQHDPGAREVQQQPLEDDLPQEAGDAGEQHGGPVQPVDDRPGGAPLPRPLLYHPADYASLPSGRQGGCAPCSRWSRHQPKP